MTSAISSAMDESAFFTTSSVMGSAFLMRKDQAALRVERRAPPGWHAALRIVLLDDKRAAPRRGEIGATEHACRQQALLRTEERVALSRAAGRSGHGLAGAQLRGHPRDDAQRDTFDFPAFGLVAVRALVLVAEGAGEAGEIALPAVDGRRDLVRLPGVAQVGELQQLDPLARVSLAPHARQKRLFERRQAFVHFWRRRRAQPDEERSHALVLDVRVH